MKRFLYLAILVPTISQAAYTPYCQGTEVNNVEDAVIQRLVPQFANQMKCEVGENCLLKWDAQKKTEKFSIAWKSQCGPIINNQRQLGDDGHGSTFTCEWHGKESLCCWPEGYQRKPFILCSDSIFKKKHR